MFRIAIALSVLVIPAVQSANAGGLLVSYPAVHQCISSEYMAANQTVYGQGYACGGVGNCRHNSTDCCSGLWSNYCADRYKSHCNTRLHTRYHWFSRPSCDCCQDYPTCGCRRSYAIKGCADACTSCLGQNVRGFWNRCKGHLGSSWGCATCGSAGCDSCGTDIISLEQSMPHESYEMQSSPQIQEIQPKIEAPKPATPQAVEARNGRFWMIQN